MSTEYIADYRHLTNPIILDCRLTFVVVEGQPAHKGLTKAWVRATPTTTHIVGCEVVSAIHDDGNFPPINWPLDEPAKKFYAKHVVMRAISNGPASKAAHAACSKALAETAINA